MALTLIKQVRDNPVLRDSFQALAAQTFGLDFAPWYRQGYWTDSYIPYALVCGNQVVANASVNRLSMRVHGQNRLYIQIGTVMTAPSFRRQGLARRLLEEILRDWRDACDTLYLYANDTVLDFYPKFGFYAQTEYQVSRPLSGGLGAGRLLDMDSPADVSLLRQAFQRANPFSLAAMTDNFGLLMFYCSSFLKKAVYYLEEAQTAVVAEFEGDTMTCYDIFGREGVPLEEILHRVARPDTRRVQFGFTPPVAAGDRVAPAREDTLFVLSGKENPWAQAPMMLPLLSHA